jgi:hypothetical protein
VHLTVRSRRLVGACAAAGVTALGAGSALAMAATPPNAQQLKKLGSSKQAEHKQPISGLGATPLTQPLIVVAFSGEKATVLGGSAIGTDVARAHTATNIPISAAECTVNFTTRETSNSGGESVTARWFSGILCTRPLEMFGQAFLAESASVFDGSGPYYSGVQTSATSGRAATVIKKSHPSLYIWSATNMFFQEKPSRGVIAVLPSPNQQVNAATTCKVVKSPIYGFGVHCDLYSNRF